MIVDGDELTAITYAVDDIARQLGVIEELPCIVILDAIPRMTVEVFHLSDEIFQVLIPLLRQTLGRFQNMKGYDEIDNALKTFINLQTQIDNVDKQKCNFKQQIRIIQQKVPRERTVNSDLFLDLIVEKRKEVEEELRSGSIKRFRRKIRQIPSMEKEFTLKLISFADFHKEELFFLNKTISALCFYADDIPWPLDVETLKSYKHIYNHARAFLEDLPSEPNHNTPEECSYIINELKQRKEAIIDMIIGKIPQPKILVQQAIKKAQERLIKKQSDHEKRVDVLSDKIKDIEANIEELNDQLNEAINTYASLELPSFSKIFKKTAKEYKISLYSKHAQNAVATFSGNLFKPETLMKLWNAVAN